MENIYIKEIVNNITDNVVTFFGERRKEEDEYLIEGNIVFVTYMQFEDGDVSIEKIIRCGEDEDTDEEIDIDFGEIEREVYENIQDRIRDGEEIEDTNRSLLNQFY